MKKFLLGTVGLVALGMASAPASAADLAARPYTKAPPMMQAVYDWSGFYVGINGGWAETEDRRVSPAGNLFGDNTVDGGTVGGQLGYRWQNGPWVFGLEAQGNWADISGSNTNLLAPAGNSIRSKMDAFGLFTGQVGYAWNNTLLYLKGGAAVTDNKYSSFFTGPGIVFNSASDTRWGGAVGVGIEYGFAPNWSVGIEYNHLFMGKPNVTFPAQAVNFPPITGAVGRTDNISQGVDMGVVRINYRFGGPVVAKY
jgi:outer membrane immunogenic protein